MWETGNLLSAYPEAKQSPTSPGMHLQNYWRVTFLHKTLMEQGLIYFNIII